MLDWNVSMEYLDRVLSKILLGTDVVSTEKIRRRGQEIAITINDCNKEG